MADNGNEKWIVELFNHFFHLYYWLFYFKFFPHAKHKSC